MPGNRPLVYMCALLAFAMPAAGQEAAAGTQEERALRLTTSSWCEDAMTICWEKSAADQDNRAWLAGVRLVFEPQLGVLIQTGDNKFVDTNFRSLEKIGLETTLYKGYVGFQTLLIYPSSIKFDDQSTVRSENQLVDTEEGKVDVEYGISLGFTLIDGVLALGWGILHYDRRDFVNPDTLPTDTFRDSFLYFNVQPIQAVKSALKAVR